MPAPRRVERRRGRAWSWGASRGRSRSGWCRAGEQVQLCGLPGWAVQKGDVCRVPIGGLLRLSWIDCRVFEIPGSDGEQGVQMVGTWNMELADAEGAGLARPAVFLLDEQGVRGPGVVQEFAGQAPEVHSTRRSCGKVGRAGHGHPLKLRCSGRHR